MDKTTKFIRRLSPKERARVTEQITKLLQGETAGLQIKKLTGHTRVYRLRVGRVRIIFMIGNTENDIEIVQVDFRDDNTYKEF